MPTVTINHSITLDSGERITVNAPSREAARAGAMAMLAAHAERGCRLSTCPHTGNERIRSIRATASTKPADVVVTENGFAFF